MSSGGLIYLLGLQDPFMGQWSNPLVNSTLRRLHTYNVAADEWSVVDVVGSNPLARTEGSLLVVAGQLLLVHGINPGIASMPSRLWHHLHQSPF